MKIKRKRKYYKKNKHYITWTKNKHYGNCGQNCPCCRFFVESLNNPNPRTWFGVCKVCASYKKYRF